MVAPPKTPHEIVDKLSSEVMPILRDPQVVAVMKKFLMTPMGTTPAEAKIFLDTESARWRELILSLGLKPQ